MDLTSLFAGPASAGPSPAAAAGAGAGQMAGPAPADAPASGFASLIDLALEQIVGKPEDEAPICGAAPSAAEGDVEEASAEPPNGDRASGGIDDLTLAVQVALALPIAVATAPMVQTPAATEAADGSTPVVDAIDPASMGAGAGAVDGVALLVAPAVPAGQAVAAPASFAEKLGAIVDTSDTSDTSATDAPPIDAPVSQAAVIDSVAALSVAPAATAPAAPAPAATTAPPAAAPGAGAPSHAPNAQPARPALHRALAALAAQAPSDPTAAPAANAATPPTPASALAHAAPAPAEPGSVSDAPARITAGVPSLADGVVARMGARGRASGEASADTSSDSPPFVPVALAPQAAAGVTADQPFAAALPSGANAPANLAILQAGLAVPVPAPSTSALLAPELPAASARFEQTLAALDPDVRNLQSMVRTVRLFTSSGGVSEARLQLEPDHLGPVALTVRIEQGTVSAHFRAETPAAQRWIETHQQELRSGLREQGLEVKDLVVTTDPDGRRERRQEGQPARPPRGRRTPADADAPRFEVLV